MPTFHSTLTRQKNYIPPTLQRLIRAYDRELSTKLHVPVERTFRSLDLIKPGMAIHAPDEAMAATVIDDGIQVLRRHCQKIYHE